METLTCWIQTGAFQRWGWVQWSWGWWGAARWRGRTRNRPEPCPGNSPSHPVGGENTETCWGGRKTTAAMTIKLQTRREEERDKDMTKTERVENLKVEWTSVRWSRVCKCLCMLCKVTDAHIKWMRPTEARRDKSDLFSLMISFSRVFMTWELTEMLFLFSRMIFRGCLICENVKKQKNSVEFIYLFPAFFKHSVPSRRKLKFSWDKIRNKLN